MTVYLFMWARARCVTDMVGSILIKVKLCFSQVQTFHGDLLQHMEKNTKLDMQFIKVSLSLCASPSQTEGVCAQAHRGAPSQEKVR